MLTSAVKQLTTVIKTVQILLGRTRVAALLAFKFLMQMGILVMVCAHMATWWHDIATRVDQLGQEC